MNINLADYPLLSQINSPKDLRNITQDQLGKISNELRSFLLNSVSKSSGHFASGLGTIELTVALHYVYETPFDHLIWDVGHQAYPHKILTGRRDQLHTIRQKGGLHPFPWREESEYDTLSVGHSSTSISAATDKPNAAEIDVLE
jgi:1-deoxy-D-xylulose-5-phosphate synthase